MMELVNWDGMGQRLPANHANALRLRSGRGRRDGHIDCHVDGVKSSLAIS